LRRIKENEEIFRRKDQSLFTKKDEAKKRTAQKSFVHEDEIKKKHKFDRDFSQNKAAQETLTSTPTPMPCPVSTPSEGDSPSYNLWSSRNLVVALLLVGIATTLAVAIFRTKRRK
jgi:hypothetical protein